MIKTIGIHNFKSIKDMEFVCGSLTVLTGANGSGKTAVMEALLLRPADMMDGNNLIKEEIFRKLHCRASAEEEILIEMTEGDIGLHKRRVYRQDDKLKMTITHNSFFKSFGNTLVLKVSEAINLAQARIPLTRILSEPVREWSWHYRYMYSTAEMIFLLANVSIPESLRTKDGCTGDSLLEQVNYWMKKVTGTEVSMKTDKYNKKFDLYISRGGIVEDMASAGVGIMYAAAIIMSCMTVPEGTVICVENPEIGLSPEAQSHLTEFLYFIACSGRQIFVETHSDHVFNTLRAGLADETMEMGKISINYLVLDKKTHETKCNPIRIGKYGKIIGMNNELSLDGFFDYHEKMLDRMLGID